MNRFQDYLCFAVRFAGLGYIVLWPVSTPAHGELFGTSLICTGKTADVFALICRMPHPLQMSIGLHAAGALCAVLATLHILLRLIGRARRRRRRLSAVPAVSPVAVVPPPAPKSRLRWRHLPPPRKLLQARSQFGLRGMPQ
jgi:hypothetical protein